MINAICAYLDPSMVMYVFRSLECANGRPVMYVFRSLECANSVLLSVIPSVSCP